MVLGEIGTEQTDGWTDGSQCWWCFVRGLSGGWWYALCYVSCRDEARSISSIYHAFLDEIVDLKADLVNDVVATRSGERVDMVTCVVYAASVQWPGPLMRTRKTMCDSMRPAWPDGINNAMRLDGLCMTMVACVVCVDFDEYAAPCASHMQDLWPSGVNDWKASVLLWVLSLAGRCWSI